MPWAKLYRDGLRLAEAYDALGPAYAGLASRMRQCGAFQEFERFFVPDRPHDFLHVRNASFCRARLCPRCQLGLSRRQHASLCAVVGAYLTAHPTDQVIMLTPTIANVRVGQLAQALDQLLGGLRRLTRRKRFADAVNGFYRKLEITRNETTGELHPHPHLLIFVPPAYFKRRSGLYIDQANGEWTELWRSCLQVDYDPIVDVRRVRGVGGGYFGEQGRRSLAELTKYVTKPDLVSALEGEPLRDVHIALKGRRLVGMSKSLRAVNDALGLPDPNTDDDAPRSAAMRLPEGALYLGREVYEWHAAGDDFVRMASTRTREAPWAE